MLVVPAAAHAVGDLLDDPQIVPRVARQRQRLAAHLHLAIGVGDGAVLLRPARGRQHHIGIDRGLGEEEILHHEMLEMRQRLARMIEIGIGHRRILALDVHALDLVVMDRVHDLDHGLALLRVELDAPGLLVLAADLRILHRLVVGEEHRDQAGVGRALHVVLAAQRMQPGAGPADLAGDQRQRDQAARIVGAVGVLRDAHAPEDDGAFARAHKCAPPRAACRRGMPQIGAISSGVKSLMLSFQASKPST